MECVQQKIGVLGGSFNPLHSGHLVLARDALEQAGLDRVLFMPCAEPPHKPAGCLASGQHRLRMLQEAVAGEPGLGVSEVELSRLGTSFTVDTMRVLKDEQPGVDFSFLIGADSLFELHTWKDIDILLTLCRFLVLARPGFDLGSGAAARVQLPAPWPEKLLDSVIAVRAMEISSTEIRKRVRAGQSIRCLVPEGVARYIDQHHLYRETP